jgi:N6-adenosine-specific RNA methylase IME4
MSDGRPEENATVGRNRASESLSGMTEHVAMPALYAKAKQNLAELTRIDEVKEIRDQSLALEVYAAQAKDAELIGYATEVRERATRRIGEIVEAMRKADRLAKGAREKGVGRRGRNAGFQTPRVKTLEEEGVDKNLAKAARSAAAMPEDKFEARVAKKKAIAVAAVQGTAEVIKAARAERHQKKKAMRQEREHALADKIAALPSARYGVILADPEWRFETWSPRGLDASSADNHYPTSPLADIKKRDVASIAADDSVLFLWATVPMLPRAIEVLSAWGFAYKSSFVWVKDRAGTGYWNRNKHEILLVGTRGGIPAPAAGEQWDSAIEAPVGRHSEKPEIVYRLIESYFPTVPRIELNARQARAGWERWGKESPGT